MIVLDTEHKLAQGVCLLVGNYDGIHLGHQRVISLARRHAHKRGLKTAVLSFEPHPLKVLDPARAPKLIHSPFLKEALLDFFNVDYYVIQKFTAEFAESEAEAFVARLSQSIDFKMLLVGSAFRFGSERRGNTDLLRQLGPRFGFELVEIDEVADGQGSISSTRIRCLLEQGKIREMERLLGHPYFLEGPVERGKQIGRKLGTPTANMKVANELIPKNGVYASWLFVDETWFPSVTNIGTRPTFGSEGIHVETHVLDFSGQIYGKNVVVCLKHFLRDEMKFETPEDLRQQIRRDIQQRSNLGDKRPPRIPWFSKKISVRECSD